MKIIALTGISNSGKTLTLRMVYDFLQKNKTNTIKPFDRKWGIERRGVFKYNGKTVGITTRGDTEDILNEDFTWMGKCDIYVCACHPSGKTIKFVKNKINRNWKDLYLIAKLRLYDYTNKDKAFTYHFNICDEMNKQQSKEIIKLLS